jgi:hypothetical protein
MALVSLPDLFFLHNCMKIKPVVQLNDSELIERLTNNSQSILSEKIDDVGFFLAHYNISKGNNLVGIELLHRLYKYWSKAPIPLPKFKKEISNHFTLYKNNYVHISFRSINITKETAKFLLQEPKKAKNYLNDLTKFSDYYSLSEGTYWADGTLLYDAFMNWCLLYKHHTAPINYVQFVEAIKVFFPYRYTKKHMFRITEVNYETLKQEQERYKARKLKKSRKKSSIINPLQS